MYNKIFKTTLTSISKKHAESTQLTPLLDYVKTIRQ